MLDYLIYFFAAVLAVMGMTVTLYPPMSEKAKRNWIVGFGLASLLLVGVQVELTRQNKHLEAANELRVAESVQREKDMGQKLDLVLEKVNPNAMTSIEQEKANTNYIEVRQQVQQETRPKSRLSLKQKARVLSSELLKFVADRDKQIDVQSATFEQDVKNIPAYTQETMNIYTQQFSARVLALRDELMAAGADGLDSRFIFENPANLIDMKEIALKIGAAAEKLPE